MEETVKRKSQRQTERLPNKKIKIIKIFIAKSLGFLKCMKNKQRDLKHDLAETFLFMCLCQVDVAALKCLAWCRSLLNKVVINCVIFIIHSCHG